MSDFNSEKAIEIIRSRLLAARTDAESKAKTAIQAAIDSKILLDEANKATEYSTSVQINEEEEDDDEDDEWGDIEDPKITNLKFEATRLATEAERLDKIAEKAIEAHKYGPTEADIKREVSLLRGALEKADYEAERKRKEDEKKAKIAFKEALQDKEARKIKESIEAKEAEEAIKKAIYDNLTPLQQKEYDERQEENKLEKEKNIFVEKHMLDSGWNLNNRHCNKHGNPCVGPRERAYKKAGEAAWEKHLKEEANRKKAVNLKGSSNYISLPFFQRDDCKFENCFKHTCNFLHTLTQCTSSRREHCQYKNCGNKYCTDLHVDVDVDV